MKKFNTKKVTSNDVKKLVIEILTKKVNERNILKEKQILELLIDNDFIIKDEIQSTNDYEFTIKDCEDFEINYHLYFLNVKELTLDRFFFEQ